MKIRNFSKDKLNIEMSTRCPKCAGTVGVYITEDHDGVVAIDYKCEQACDWYRCTTIKIGA